MSVEFENGQATSLSTGYRMKKYARGKVVIIEGFEMRRDDETGTIVAEPYTILKRKHHPDIHTKHKPITYSDMIHILHCRREDLRAKRRKLEDELESNQGTIDSFTAMATEWAAKRPG